MLALRCAGVLEFAEVSGRRIAYERSGSGRPIVLFHGGVSDHREWDAQTSSFAIDHTVVAWDAPGCGGSEDPPEDLGIEGYGEAALALVSSLGLERPHVVGVSFGATLALEVYRQRPDLPATLALISGYAGWAGSLPSEEVAAREASALRALDGPRSEFVEALLSTLFSSDAPAECVVRTRAVMSDFRAAGARAGVQAMAAADLRPVLSSVDAPTLLMYGDADVRSPLQVAEQMRVAIPGAELVVLPGVGHLCNVEAPALVNAALRDFFLRSEIGTRRTRRRPPR